MHTHTNMLKVSIAPLSLQTGSDYGEALVSWGRLPALQSLHQQTEITLIPVFHTQATLSQNILQNKYRKQSTVLFLTHELFYHKTTARFRVGDYGLLNWWTLYILQGWINRNQENEHLGQADLAGFSFFQFLTCPLDNQGHQWRIFFIFSIENLLGSIFPKSVPLKKREEMRSGWVPVWGLFLSSSPLSSPLTRVISCLGEGTLSVCVSICVSVSVWVSEC